MVFLFFILSIICVKNFDIVVVNNIHGICTNERHETSNQSCMAVSIGTDHNININLKSVYGCFNKYRSLNKYHAKFIFM